MKHFRVTHLLDDVAMGGVTRALTNFEHPSIQKVARHDVVDINHGRPTASSCNDIAVIHFTMNWRKIPYLLDLRLRSRFSRIVLIEHTYTEGFERSEVEQIGRFRRMLKTAYGLVDTVVAVSEAQREWIVSSGLASADKVIAIAQSRDCTNLLDIAPAQRSEGPLRIGAFGRYHKQKGFDLLIDAMTKIDPQTAQLTLAGKGPDLQRLSAQAGGLSHVSIQGPFTSPKAFLTEIDIVAIPSRWEAFGLVGTEARAAARPMITANIDGLRDQVGHHAFRFECGDVPSLVCAIEEAAAAVDLNDRALAAREHVRGEYERLIEDWYTLLFDRFNHRAAA